MSTTITVKIGTFERTYTLVRATAPKEYDGFGTLEVYESGNKEERYVLIDVDHKEWQEGRYGSGLYTFKDIEENLILYVQEQLFKRLTESTTQASLIH